MIIKAPKGTNDLILENIKKWHFLEKIIYNQMKIYGFEEIRTPIFEDTELFLKTLGVSSDIINKEMYTFLDKSNRSITLRPEHTAPIARSFIEHNEYNKILPAKYYYNGSVFRYSRPQLGRFRQFNQFGVEVLGSKNPIVDADVILIASNIISLFGLKKIKILINSVGCSLCRPNFKNLLQSYLKDFLKNLCITCKKRFKHNPLRIFDCKNIVCREIILNAPKITDYLCKECDEHLKKVMFYLNLSKIKYSLEKTMVRGLDYYTKTAFELIIKENNNSQNSIAGGGRYDNLTKILGGPEIGGVGFSVGLERVILNLDLQKFTYPINKDYKIFIASINKKTNEHAYYVMTKLRSNGINASIDLMDRKLKSQFKYANKINATHVITIGENEIESKLYPLKNMIKRNEKINLSLNEVIKILKKEEV